MKIFGFYFFVTLAAIISMIVFSLAGVGVSLSLRPDWPTLLQTFLFLLMGLAPIHLLHAGGEPNWVRNLFVVPLLGKGIFFLILLGPALFHQRAPHWAYTVLGFFGVGSFIAILVACFSTRTTALRLPFRWMGILSAVAWLGDVTWTVMQVRLGFHPTSRGVLRQLTFLPSHLILLFLCYRFWREAPGEPAWQSAVESIGQKGEL